MQAHQLIEEALKLKAEDRSAIVDRLLESLDRPDPGIDRQWGEEAARRARAVDDGRLKTYPLDDVLAEATGPR